MSASHRNPTTVKPKRIGVMQGRLSQRPPDRIQAFPAETWALEFPLARQVGFDCIEWVLETPPGPDNPLWSTEGRDAIRRAAGESGVEVSSVCADYFMSASLATSDAGAAERHVAVMRELVHAAAQVGATRILVPLVEHAALSTEAMRDAFRKNVRACAVLAEAYSIVLALEMEIPGPEYAAFVRSVDHPLVRACYDTGNSAAQGFDIGADVHDVAPLLDAIHVKDRLVGGTTQPLGTGHANFSGLWATLGAHGFGGDVILQHYFGADPLFDALRSLNFVRLGVARATREVA